VTNVQFTVSDFVPNIVDFFVSTERQTVARGTCRLAANDQGSVIIRAASNA
jgi:hypothetical protein